MYGQLTLLIPENTLHLGLKAVKHEVYNYNLSYQLRSMRQINVLIRKLLQVSVYGHWTSSLKFEDIGNYYKAPTNYLCYASWVWTGYEPYKIFPSVRYIILARMDN